MIISSLISGTGNQMFQYAAGFALAKRRQVRFHLDLRWYDSETAKSPPRPYNLSRLSISAPAITAVDRYRLSLLGEGRLRLAKRLLRRIPTCNYQTLVDANSGYDPRLESASARTYLVGYWECERYFAGYRDQLLEEFRFRNAANEANRAMLDDIAAGPSACLHVRRGDLTNPNNATQPCPIGYYERGIAHLQARVPNVRFFVFSDDPSWCRANLPVPQGSVFVTHNVGVDDVEDLRLMTACQHFVIANSTFSWWGAWLSEHPDKIVIAPARWWEKQHGNEKDIVPAGWLRL